MEFKVVPIPVPDFLLSVADFGWNAVGLCYVYQFALDFPGGALGFAVRTMFLFTVFRMLNAFWAA